MTRENLSTGISFLGLILFQTFVFNHINLFGYINPLVYVLFLVHYPFDKEQTLFIFLGFALGLGIDFLSQTGGAHTFATLITAFIRPQIVRYAYGLTAELPTRFLNETRSFNNFLFLTFILLIHHLLYFTVVYFSWDALGLILKNTFSTALFSLILIGIISRFYRK